VFTMVSIPSRWIQAKIHILFFKIHLNIIHLFTSRIC
jgi:hypothetical protein